MADGGDEDARWAPWGRSRSGRSGCSSAGRGVPRLAAVLRPVDAVAAEGDRAAAGAGLAGADVQHAGRRHRHGAHRLDALGRPDRLEALAGVLADPHAAAGRQRVDRVLEHRVDRDVEDAAADVARALEAPVGCGDVGRGLSRHPAYGVGLGDAARVGAGGRDAPLGVERHDVVGGAEPELAVGRHRGLAQDAGRRGGRYGRYGRRCGRRLGRDGCSEGGGYDERGEGDASAGGQAHVRTSRERENRILLDILRPAAASSRRQVPLPAAAKEVCDLRRRNGIR